MAWSSVALSRTTLDAPQLEAVARHGALRRRAWSLIAATLTATALTAAPARAITFGFNDNGVAQEVVSAERDAELLANVGATIQRSTFNWRYAEKVRGRYALNLYDRLYRETTSRGVRPLFILKFAPDWAWAPGISCPLDRQCPYPPDRRHLADWRRLVTMLVERYPLLAGLEVWNEPNLEVFWFPKPDPKHYARLVKHAYRAVRATGADIPVLAGSLANAPDTFGIPGIKPARFLRRAYRAGMARHHDGLSVHPYPIGVNLAPMFKTLTDVDRLRARFRDPAPIWVTETGTTTTGQVSESHQAELLVRVYDILATRPGIESMLVHTLVEPPFGASGETGYGIVRRDGMPKPAYCALATRMMRSPRDCVLSVFGTQTDTAQQHRWDAQVSVQGAVDAAAAYARGHKGSLDGFALPNPSPPETQQAGSGADPGQVGIYRFGPTPNQSAVFCAASRADKSYCAMYARKTWSYGHATGSIGGAAAATIQGVSRGW